MYTKFESYKLPGSCTRFSGTTLLSLLLPVLMLPGCKKSETPCPPCEKVPADSGSVLSPERETSVSIKKPPIVYRPLTPSLASKLVQLSIHCAGREYPNKPGDVQSSDEDVVPPRKLHPAFYGCFDWHSAVHGHYTMVRVLRLFPNIDSAGRILEILDRHLEPSLIQVEADYFKGRYRKLFERPYGWAWLLRLAAEIDSVVKDEATGSDLRKRAEKWAVALKPLEDVIVDLTMDYLTKLSLPVRAGTHNSTAFALAHIHDYAKTAGREDLEQAVNRASRKFFLEDRNCPTSYEPSGEDFISPCLAQADLMRRALDANEFQKWLHGFLPDFSDPEFKPLLSPPEILDIEDGRIGHLIGLMFHRAWTFRGIARALDAKDPRKEIMIQLSHLHEHEGLRLMFDSGYGGTHWLASFAVFSLTDSNESTVTKHK